jgi:O-antigen ligase
MGLLKIFFSVFLLSFPLAEVGRIQFENGVAITLNDLFLGVLFFYWVVYRFLIVNKPIKSYLNKPILIFIFAALLSLVINFFNLSINNFLIASLYLIRFVCYLSLYFIVKEFSPSFKKRITFLLMTSGLLVLLLGYIQYFLYPSLRNLFYLGWDEHLYRMFSTFLDPNFAGIFFAIFFIYNLIFVKEYISKKYNIKSLMFLSLSVITLIGVYLTYSRSAFIALIVATTTYLILIEKKRFIVFALAFLLLIIFIAPKSFRTEGTNLLRINSSTARINSTEQGIQIFQQNPIFGVGFNAYRYAQNKYLDLNNSYWQVTHSGAGTDNSFIFIIATTGIVGLVSYLYLLKSIFVLSKNNIRKNKYAIVLFSSLLGLIASSIFINSLFYVLLLEWVWLLAGLTESS